MKHFYISLLIPTLFFFVSGCSSDEKTTAQAAQTEAEKLYKQSEEHIDDKRYILAIDKLNTIKNQHPFSKYAVLAQLKLADVYFLQENYSEAISAYQAFRDLHPKHEKIEYVIFQLADAHFRNLPDTIDRDLMDATRAIQLSEELVASFPQSGLRTRALDIRDKAQNKLLEKEDYIGNFYFVRDHWEPSIRRYELLRRKFPGSRLDDKALFRIAIGFFKLEKIDQAKETFEEMKKLHPQSDYTEKLAKAIQ